MLRSIRTPVSIPDRINFSPMGTKGQGSVMASMHKATLVEHGIAKDKENRGDNNRSPTKTTDKVEVPQPVLLGGCKSHHPKTDFLTIPHIKSVLSTYVNKVLQ